MSSNEYKEQGNAAFKTANYPAAIENYTKAIELIESSGENKEILTSLYSNRSLCFLKTNEIFSSFIDAQKGLNDLPQSHPLYLKLAIRSVSTQLSLSTQDDIDAVLSKDDDLLQKTANDLKSTATTLLNDIIKHPELNTIAGVAQMVNDEIKKHSLDITPVTVQSTKPAAKTTSKPTPTATAKNHFVAADGSTVEAMTMADLQRLSQMNSQTQQQQQQQQQQSAWGQQPQQQSAWGQPPQQKKPALQGVWASGGGAALSKMVSKDIENNGGPIVIQSNDPFIASIQREKQLQATPKSEWGSFKVTASANDVKKATNDKDDENKYLPPQSRYYSNEQLQQMINTFNNTTQNDAQVNRIPGFYGSLVDPNTFSLPDDKNNYINLPAAPLQEDDTKTVKSVIKKQWRNASMIPRSPFQPLSDYDTASEGEHDDFDDKGEETPKEEIVEQDDETNATRNQFDPTRFDNLNDNESDDERQEIANNEEKKRLSKQRRVLLEKQRHRRMEKYSQILQNYKVNHHHGHVHDGCLTHIKPNRVDDRVKVFCCNEYGILMIGSLNDEEKENNKRKMNGEKVEVTPITTPSTKVSENELPFVFADDQKDSGLDNTKKDQDEDDQKMNNEDETTPLLTSPTVPSAIQSKYSWALPGTDSSALLMKPFVFEKKNNESKKEDSTATTTTNSPQPDDITYHPSVSDMALISLANTFQKSTKMYESIKKMTLLKSFGLHEFPSLKFPRRLTHIIKAEIDTNDDTIGYWYSNDEFDDQFIVNANDREAEVLTSQQQCLPEYCIGYIPFDILLDSNPDIELSDYQTVNFMEALISGFKYNDEEKNTKILKNSKILSKMYQDVIITVKDGTKPLKLPQTLPSIGHSVGSFTPFSKDMISVMNKDGIVIENESVQKAAFNQHSLFFQKDEDVKDNVNQLHFPFSTLETIVLSTSPDVPDEPAILLVQRVKDDKKNQSFTWSLPITHLDDADTITFTSTRLIHSLFGVLSEKWSLVDIIQSTTPSQLDFSLPFKKTHQEFNKINKNTVTTTTNDKSTTALQLTIPNDQDDEHSYYKGFRAISFTHLYGKNHRNPSATSSTESTPGQATLQFKKLESYWPSRTKPAGVNYRWVTQKELAHMKESTDDITFNLLTSVFDRFDQHYHGKAPKSSNLLKKLIDFEKEKPLLSPAQQHEIQRVQQEENSVVDTPFGFGSLLSIETLLTKQAK